MSKRSPVVIVLVVLGMLFAAFAMCGVGMLVLFLRNGQKAADAAYASERRDDVVMPAGSPTEPTKEYRVPSWWSWSPQQIANLYEENELGAESEFDRRVTIVGLVDSIQRDTINQPMLVLQVGEVKRSSQHQNSGQLLAALSGVSQGLVCRLSETSVAAAARLSRGGLVAVQGHGGRKGLRGIEFTDCDVTWVYSKTDTVANLPSQQLAQMVDLCVGKRLMRMPKIDEKQKAHFEKIGSDATAALSAAGITPQCDHPLMVTVMNCDGEKGRPECATPLIKNATDRMARSK